MQHRCNAISLGFDVLRHVLGKHSQVSIGQHASENAYTFLNLHVRACVSYAYYAHAATHMNTKP
jgi:hypothetical protein